MGSMVSVGLRDCPIRYRTCGRLCGFHLHIYDVLIAFVVMISSQAGTRRLRIAIKAAMSILLAFAALIILYLGAALAGSLLPANAGWKAPREGVLIYVYTNGVHTGLILPKNNAMKDWRRLVKADHLADRRYGASSHLLFGWGERRFYLGTPTWAELNPLVAGGALIYGSRTLLHVDHIHNPRPGPEMRPLRISTAQYEKLVRGIENQFQLDSRGQAQPLRGYGRDDVFYESGGHYDLFRTCNAWTGNQLRSIGVRVGYWTPFSQSVMMWF